MLAQTGVETTPFPISLVLEETISGSLPCRQVSVRRSVCWSEGSDRCKLAMSGCSQGHEHPENGLCRLQALSGSSLLKFPSQFRSRSAKCRDLAARLGNNRGLHRACPVLPPDSTVASAVVRRGNARERWVSGVVGRGLRRVSFALFIAEKAWSVAIGEDHRGYGVQKLVPSKKKLTRNVLVDYFRKVFNR